MGTGVEQKKVARSSGIQKRFPMLYFFATVGMIFVGLAIFGGIVIIGWALNIWKV